MPLICLYFQAHQPFRLRRYTFFDIGHDHRYEDEEENRSLLDRVANKCYLPANALLRRLMDRHGHRFRCCLSITGCLIDQLQRYRPDVLASFQDLAKTGQVEFLGETDAHSLAFLYTPAEFRAQVTAHRRRMETLFGQRPTTFRHTELIYNNELAAVVAGMGFRVILTEGVERLLGGRPPGLSYRPPGDIPLRIPMRQARLSDDIAFRFPGGGEFGQTLNAERYVSWVRAAAADGGAINLFMDYETLGEHHWPESGIFAFFASFVDAVLDDPAWRFATAEETAATVADGGVFDCPAWVSWADTERDLTAWTGNAMQRDALAAVYALEGMVAAVGNGEFVSPWRRLQTSDHFYYMATKEYGNGAVHRYFNPYASPYDAYVNYMNCLDDFARRLKKEAGL
ncbi:MAG: glycoside hydrolase family 57 protein [Syntrophales bacterium]|nr:glycoside hydrolase family 57 protein [Syntrophales bacterium]